MRRPWMVTGVAVGAAGTLVVATAPNIATVLVGWCVCQVFNATLAAQAAVLPDQVPSQQRGLVSGLLGLSVPAASVAGTYLVQAFDYSTVLMFTVPCAVGGLSVLLFTWRLPDRRLAPADKRPWSLRELGRTFYVSPRRNPDFAWAFLPVPPRHSVRIPRHLPGLLPHRPGRQQRGRGAAAGIPRHRHPVHCPWLSEGWGSACTWPSTSRLSLTSFPTPS